MSSLRAIQSLCTASIARKQRIIVQSAAGTTAGNNSLLPFHSNVVHFSTRPPPSPTSNKQSSSMNPFAGMWDSYQENRTRKAFREQMEDVQKVDHWTLGAYYEQLSKTATSWKSKIPGVSSATEVKNAKESYEIVECIMNIVGQDASLDDVFAFGRKEKLKAANAAGVTVERINQEIRNFEVTNQTHILMMELKKLGKPIPETPDEMRNLVQVHARKLLSKEEKERMAKIMQNKMKKDMNRRR